jgi:hypothetical protein
MTMELAWMITNLQENIWEIIDRIEQIKESYGMNEQPIVSPIFNPLRTYRKYC